MRVLVFLPTYNEKDNLVPVVEEIFSLGLDIHVFVVDDQSPDGTGEVAEELSRQHPGQVTIMHRPPPRGRGLAGIDGLRWAGQHAEFDFTIEMDADRSHPVRFIPAFLQAIQADPSVDIIIGSRHLPGSEVVGWPRWRYLNSAVANWLARLCLGLPKGDVTSGYRCFRTSALARLPWDRMITTGPAIVEEILFYSRRAGMRWREIPITFVDRVAGESKVSAKLILRWIKEMLAIRQGRPGQ